MNETHSMEEYLRMQESIDRVTPERFSACYATGEDGGELSLKAFLSALPKAVEESKTAENLPAVWLIYNMGLLVKTRETVFTVDLFHPGAVSLASSLDFALITHNHEDHYDPAFLGEMNGKLHKTVVSNFSDNYGAYRKEGSFGGGYTRGGKAFEFGDVKIFTFQADHNDYLADFTMPFEIHVGGKVIYHTGDCCRADKLNPTVTPDIWIVHPLCGLDVEDGYRKFRPGLTVIGHLNEFLHPRGCWRWSWEDGFAAARKIEALGGQTLVPLWGDRIL